MNASEYRWIIVSGYEGIALLLLHVCSIWLSVNCENITTITHSHLLLVGYDFLLSLLVCILAVFLPSQGSAITCSLFKSIFISIK